MPSSTSSFKRVIPALPWRGLALAAVLLTGVATAAWELRARAWGYGPSLNDTPDLWAQQRGKVRPDSLVIIGDSRPHFDLDLDQLEQGLGRRPLQLAIDGSCAYPILADLAAAETFHGTVICSVVPLLFFAPGGPPLANSEEALKRDRTWTWAQRSGNALGLLLEERVAFLKQDDLTLDQLLKRLPIPNRANAQIGPVLPPYFGALDCERRERMIAACALPGPLRTRVKLGWPPTCRRRRFSRAWAGRSKCVFTIPSPQCARSGPAAARLSSSVFPPAAK